MSTRWSVRQPANSPPSSRDRQMRQQRDSPAGARRLPPFPFRKLDPFKAWICAIPHDVRHSIWGEFRELPCLLEGYGGGILCHIVPPVQDSILDRQPAAGQPEMFSTSSGSVSSSGCNIPRRGQAELTSCAVGIRGGRCPRLGHKVGRE